MKKGKKILKISLISILAIIVLAIASTYIFRGKIVELVKTEINKNINARVDFSGVNISVFRSFPRVSIGLDDIQVIGTGIFGQDTLLAAKRLDAAVNVMSFIRGKDMNIYSISLDNPRIHALVSKDGIANWDIVKPDSASKPEEKTEPFHLQLKKYKITDGYIFYDDKESNMSAEVINLNHTGSGDFTADLFTLFTTTTIDALTYTYGGIPFLNKVKANMNADIKIDNTNGKYSFDNVSILLNALKITGSGFIKMPENGYDMDISFKSPDTDFKHLLSLIPAVYKNDFDKVTASGSAAFEGRIKGFYSDNSIPGYHVSMTVKNGAFKYSDLPKGIEQVNINAVVDNPDGNTDNTVVNISDASFKMGSDPFSFRLLLKNPVTSMYVDAAAKGRLDLNQLGQFVKFEKGTSISGLLNADVTVKGNVSDLEKKQYQNFFAGGIIDLNNLNYTSADYPSGIKINSLNTKFSPSKVDITNLNGEYLKTKFNGEGQINNLLNYMLSDKPLSANINFNADRINLNDWMGTSADTSTSTSGGPFIVPANLDVSLKANAGQVDYDKLDIKNLSGILTVADQMVRLNNVSGNALDGAITINGSYSTRENKKNPDISMSYKIDRVDIQKTFYAFATAQKLMPIGKFLSGKITSSLAANGKLGEDMNVEMNTLSGEGNLLLIEGVLSKFSPLDKIASTLHVAQLQNISMKDVKAFFEFSNGKMLIKPFTVKLNGIEMEIGGLQGFDESIDYAVNLKLPRSMMGAQGNQLVNNLASAVSSKGIPVNVGETVNLKLQLGGTMKNPTIKTDLRQTGESLAAQMKDQVKEFAQNKIDSAKAAARDTLNSVKKQLTEAAKETLKDELKRQLTGQKDTTASEGASPKNTEEKVKESAKGLLKGMLGKKRDTSKKN